SSEVKAPPPDVPRPMDWSSEGRAQRLEFLEHMGIAVPHLAGRAAPPEPAELQGSIEQYIGMTQIPTGLIGPIRVNGVHPHGDHYVPLETTDGTLVASYHRGARLADRARRASAMLTADK